MTPPDVNVSEAGFTVIGREINFGLLAIKNLGRGVIQNLIREREARGPFASLPDFCERMHGKDVNKRAIESLIRSGAFDAFPHNRREMMRAYEGIVDQVDDNRRRNVEGQVSLFSMVADAPPAYEIPHLSEYPAAELLAMEKETVGLYLSGHPLDQAGKPPAGVRVTPIADLLPEEEEQQQKLDGRRVTLFGILQHKRTLSTKSGGVMAFLRLEDKTGWMEAVVFPKIYAQNAPLLAEGAILLCSGRVSVKEEEQPKLICEQVAVPGQAAGGEERPAGTLYLKFSGEEDPALPEIRELLRRSPGQDTVVFYFEDRKSYFTLKDCRIRADGALLKQLKMRLDEDKVVYKTPKIPR